MVNYRTLGLATLALAVVAAPSSAQPTKEDKKEPSGPAVAATDQTIVFWQDRVKRDPQDYMSQTMLGYVYIRKARETGDFAQYDKAEAALRDALKLEKDYLGALANLALVRCARHQFKEALQLGQQLYRKNPQEPSLLLIVGDAHLELGHYAEAENAYRDMHKEDPALQVPDRFARLAELKGNTKEALRLMQEAADAERQARVSREGGAWYEARLGEMHFNAGHPADAAKHYQAALKEFPNYYVALAGLGRVRAAEGKLDEAIELYRKAVTISPDPLVLTPLGDLYLKSGNDFLAQVMHDKLEKSAQGQPAYNRELALFYADHDRKLPEAVERARKDLEVRQDVYAHDALAWALCKNGRYQEAATAMAEALKLGTQDAAFFYHAGMIYRGLGDQDKARTYLQKALALNPHFSILQADRAKAALAALGAK
jgi:tetratricopeptide (TPR) repeat protein